MQVFSSNYTGNNTAGHAITGVGFQPVCVIIKARTGSVGGALTISTMGADTTLDIASASASFAGAITSLDADGFTLGTNVRVNANAVLHDFIAFGDNGVTDIHVDTYVGTGVSHDITTAGFQPDLLILVRLDGANRPVWKTSDMGTNTAFFGAANNASGNVSAFVSNGFTVGTGSGGNTNLINYYYIALKKVTGFLNTLTYTGDTNDNRSIAGAGFQPDNVWTKAATGTVAAAWRGKSEAGDASSKFDGTNETTNIIQALEADGFQVGTNAAANSSTVAMFAAVFKDGNSALFSQPLPIVLHNTTQAVQRAATH